MVKIILPGIEKDITVYLVGIGYENSKEEIFRCCDGWVGHVDGMVWFDGRFDFFPAENDYSTTGWLDAAESRYGSKCDFIAGQYSGRQIIKRQKTFDAAAKAGADYIIVVDTEEWVDPLWNDFDRFYKHLVALSEYTKDRNFYQWIYIPSAELWPKQGNDSFPDNRWIKSTRIHKDPGTIRYAMHNHFTWADKNVTDDALIQWQLKFRGLENPYQIQARNVVEGVRIRQDRTLRSKEFNEKEAEWARMNQHAENSRNYYAVAKYTNTKPPEGYATWEEWEKKPHTFDKITGQRIEL